MASVPIPVPGHALFLKLKFDCRGRSSYLLSNRPDTSKSFGIEIPWLQKTPTRSAEGFATWGPPRHDPRLSKVNRDLMIALETRNPHALENLESLSPSVKEASGRKQLRYLNEAAFHDLVGKSNEEASGDRDPRQVRRDVAAGRLRLKGLNAWPWCYFDDGKLPLRWWEDLEVRAGYMSWLGGTPHFVSPNGEIYSEPAVRQADSREPRSIEELIRESWIADQP